MDAHAHQANDDGGGVSAVVWMRQTFCALHGHDNLRQFERNRVFLRCVSCGHETPGWSLTEAPPMQTFEGDAQRHVLSGPHLVEVGRAA